MIHNLKKIKPSIDIKNITIVCMSPCLRRFVFG